ncbi:dihydrofolate reductase family protein [Dactylosporangium sp. CS-047395]|uniref:dihydrofolate reductase family protein n=1 Tax=Dactylosporangium sp. CS-047395 TaxID=3239936 RepID=UPI003D8C8C2F
MRELVVTENITVDGVIDAGGDWFSPASSADTEDLNAALREHMAGADAVLLGRETFEAFREYWPKQTGDTTGVSEYLNRVHKYVLSGTLTEPGWDGSTIVRSLDEVARIKEQPGGTIVATGSVRMVQELARSGLVDEYRLFVYPVVRGEGRRLFDNPHKDQQLATVEVRHFVSGIILVRYRTV